MKRPQSLIIAGVVALAAGCTAEIKDDDVQFNELDRLRVMAVRSEPPDLVAGETATLSALVYAPMDAPVRYRWSWCPARAGQSENFRCLVEEDELRTMLEGLGGGGEL